MSDGRICPNTPKYPCGGCPACQVPLAASDSPGRPQAPIPPEGLAAGPGIAPGGLDAAGFGSWPSEEEIEAHGNGLWLIRQKGDMAPGQIRSMALGRFGKEEGRTVWWSGGRFSDREHMSAWTFCPIDENGDKLDAAPVLRGEDARRLIEQLGQVVSPEEIARRREEARRHLAELDRSVSRMRADARALDKGVLVSKLGDEIQVDGFKDEHIRLALGRKEAQRVLSTLPARSPDRRTLVVLRGLPGSGKSTVAQAIVDSDPARWVRVSKDDLRQMMVGPNGDLFRFVEDKGREAVVSKTADEMAMSALRLGLDVVVDATNLTGRALAGWRLAASVVNRDGHGPVLVCERATDTPLEECVARDKLRGKRSVGEAVIRRLAATIDLPLEDRDWEAGS